MNKIFFFFLTDEIIIKSRALKSLVCAGEILNMQ